MDCKSTFDSTQCDKVSVDGIVSYPIDWTVCPSNRFRDCDPNVRRIHHEWI